MYLENLNLQEKLDILTERLERESICTERYGTVEVVCMYGTVRYSRGCLYVRKGTVQ